MSGKSNDCTVRCKGFHLIESEIIDAQSICHENEIQRAKKIFQGFKLGDKPDLWINEVICGKRGKQMNIEIQL